MTDVSNELLPCPFCGGSAKHMGGHVRCTNDACPVDVSALTSLDWNTRAQPAPADMVEAVARALARSDGIPDDAPTGDYLRNAKAALAAIPVSGEVERLREALVTIRNGCNYGVNSPGRALDYVDKIARQALTPPRSIRVSDLTDEEVEAIRKPSA